MKTLSISCNFLIALLLSCASQTKEDFGLALFNSIRDNDDKVFHSMILTEEDVNEFLDETVLSESQEIKTREYLIDYQIPAWEIRYKSVLESLHKEVEDLNLNWQSAIYDSTVYDINKRQNKKSDIFVYFTIENSKFKIKADDCLQTSAGWVLVDDVMLWEIK